jgi:GAF domain-containing protein
MRALFELFLDICLLRKGPQHVPDAPVLLRLTAIAYGLSGLLVSLITLAAPAALFLTLLDLALLSGLTYGLLRFRGYLERLSQTLTALFGAGTLLQLVALPLVIWLTQESVARTAGQEAMPELPSLLYFFLFGWNIAVLAHIVRQALSFTLGGGLLCALGYILLYWTLSDWLYPVI